VGFVIKPWLSSRAFDDKEMVEAEAQVVKDRQRCWLSYL
jgi:hypothetical protein